METTDNAGVPDSSISEESPEVLETPEEAAHDAAAAEALPDAEDAWDWGSWSMETAEDVPEQHRGIAGAVLGRVQEMLAARDAKTKEWEDRANHHRALWEQVLRDEQPEAFAEHEKTVADLKREAANRQKIIDELTGDRDHYKANFEEHVTKSNDQYLTWVEAKHKADLEQDRDTNNSAVLLSAQDLVVELQFDPDDALTLGFSHGVEAMAVAADLCQKGLPPEDALRVAKTLHPEGAHIPVPAPEPEPEPEPQASHSPSADVVDGGDLVPRSPERSWNSPKTKPNLWSGDNSLDDFLNDAVAGLFK